MTGVAERLTWWLVGSSQLGCSLVGQRAGHSDAPCPGEKPPPEVLMLDFYIFASPVIFLAFIEEKRRSSKGSRDPPKKSYSG